MCKKTLADALYATIPQRAPGDGGEAIAGEQDDQKEQEPEYGSR